MRKWGRRRAAILGVAIVGSLLAASAPAESFRPLPLKCDVAGSIAISSSGPDNIIGESFNFNGNGVCGGDLSGPYTASAKGSGGYCVRLVTISSGLDPCVDWSMNVSLTIVSQKTGQKKIFKQRWISVPGSASAPFVVLDTAGGGIQLPVGAGAALIREKRFCRDWGCRYGYTASWVFITPAREGI